MYEDIQLVFGRKTGYGAIGPINIRGATVIKLKEFINEKGDTDFIFDYYII